MMMQRRSPIVRFRDLNHAAINADLQIHTTWTDGKMSVQEVLETARERKLGAVAFTEHVRRDTAWFGDFARSVREEARAFPEIEVFVGCEAKALDTGGALDVSDEVRAQCDLVLGVVHRFPDGRGGFVDLKTLDRDTCAEMECHLTLGLLRTAPIHVLGHPGGMTQRRFGWYPETLFRSMLEASMERNIAVEINSSYLVNVQAFLDLCDEINPVVSIGSDAHTREGIGRCRDMLLAIGHGS
jgi:putative hydrolase